MGRGATLPLPGLETKPAKKVPEHKPCPHGSYFHTLCPICTPPSEKEVEAQCDQLMKALGWQLVRFSQPRHTMQSHGIPDRRYYPPRDRRGDEWGPFWFECKREGGKQRPEQKDFEQMCRKHEEDYVLGGLKELAAYLREKKIADVGIR
jgi:hypothetical protein